MLYLLFEHFAVKIHLPAYPRGVHSIVVSASAADLALDPELFAEPIELRLQLDRHDPYFQFRCRASAVAQCQCDRCMSKYVQLVEVDSPMLYVVGQRVDGDVDDPEIVYLPAGTTEIDLSGDLRDFLLLSLPGRLLCRDDCRGLCPQCGVDRNESACACDSTLIQDTNGE